MSHNWLISLVFSLQSQSDQSQDFEAFSGEGQSLRKKHTRKWTRTLHWTNYDHGHGQLLWQMTMQLRYATRHYTGTIFGQLPVFFFDIPDQEFRCRAEGLSDTECGCLEWADFQQHILIMVSSMVICYVYKKKTFYVLRLMNSLLKCTSSPYSN